MIVLEACVAKCICEETEASFLTSISTGNGGPGDSVASNMIVTLLSPESIKVL